MDFGLNSLFTSLWYDHKISPAQKNTNQTEDMVMFGPLCMNIDVVRESINMPMLQKGDQVVVHRVGAYNMTQWMQFITLRPNIILIDNENETHIIRKAETLEYIQSQEITPEHLK
jgi:diaminopimelate decarboxylase